MSGVSGLASGLRCGTRCGTPGTFVYVVGDDSTVSIRKVTVGATNGDIYRLVVFEGMMIGVISWALAAVASLPLTFLMNSGVGAALFTIPLDFYFSWTGLVLWLVVILSLSALASLLPASRTVRLTIRDVLAYE